MESLLSNYGSEDEEDEKPQKQPLLSRAKTPHNDASTCKSSLFASLPTPKAAHEETQMLEFRVLEGANKGNMAPEEPSVAAHRTRPDAGIAYLPVPNLAAGKKVSLFDALPPPKAMGSSMLTPLLPAKSKPSAPKRVVEVRPSINMALLYEDDDDIQPKAKRHAMDGAAGGKATGLAAILPKPKNLGSALGSGFGGGHHATLEIGDAANYLPKKSEVTRSASAPQSVHDPSSLWQGGAGKTWTNFNGQGDEHVDADGSQVSTPVGAWEGYCQDVDATLQEHVETVPSSASSYSSFVSQENAEALASQDLYGAPDDHYQGEVAHETAGSYQPMPIAGDSLAHMLMKERRKGGKPGPLNIIEVKQADLTAKKLREDQLRTTGIAFGPAYKPVSSNKDKPSKLHRRKHQIGSLYYDMKQKEMELLERRSRGYMTKSETQAKYGW